MSKWVSADSSRCLFAGYQYECSLAGFYDWQTSTAKHRQQGLNFAGFAKRTDLSGASRREGNYTLHRHYDPVLMRFTSPDPAASPWWNLSAYCSNSPAAAYDPDGLSPKKWSSETFTKDLIDSGLDVVEGSLLKLYGGPLTVAYSGKQMTEGTAAKDTVVGQSISQLNDNYWARYEYAGGNPYYSGLWASYWTVGEVTGWTGVSEGLTGNSTINVAELSGAEREARLKDGLSSGIAFWGPSATLTYAPALARIGGSPILRSTTKFSKLPYRTLRPGPYAMESIPASSSKPVFTAAERSAIDAIGYKYGCHTCGQKFPGTKKGHFIPDHQTSSSLMLDGEPGTNRGHR